MTGAVVNTNDLSHNVLCFFARKAAACLRAVFDPGEART
jgi:hypothetical protein